MLFYLALTILLAGANANEDEIVLGRNARLVTDIVASAVEDIQWQIRDAGLDPLHVENDSVYNYALPVPIIFNLETFAIELLFTGLSDIQITRVNFSLLSSRLTFDMTIPLIDFNLNGGTGHVVFFAEDFNGEASGQVSIHNVRATGEANINIGLISGVYVRSLKIDFSIGEIRSNMRAAVSYEQYNYDISNYINEFFLEYLPEKLDEYEAEINELLEIIATQWVNDTIL